MSEFTDWLKQTYEKDETLWLDHMARLIQEGDMDELDVENLRDFLLDMAKRDRREVCSRLVTVMTQMLKIAVCAKMGAEPPRSWELTMYREQMEVSIIFEYSETLRKYAEEQLPQIYPLAVELAAVELSTGSTKFPQQIPWTLDQVVPEP